jgi:hypothetical protein
MAAQPPVLLALPSIPDDAPEAVKNGLAIRNAASASGVCPNCRAKGELTGPDALGFFRITFRHETSCRALLD